MGASRSLLIALALASPAFAGEPAACGAATAGSLSDQAGVRCECRFFRGGTMVAAPAGYRWDCGVLQGRRNEAVPAAPAYFGPLPDVILEGEAVIEERRFSR